MPKTHARVWVAKPNQVVRARTPEELARQQVVVHPWSLTELWGEDAAVRYMKTMGMTDRAVRENTAFHNQNSRHELK